MFNYIINHIVVKSSIKVSMSSFLISKIELSKKSYLYYKLFFSAAFINLCPKSLKKLNLYFFIYNKFKIMNLFKVFYEKFIFTFYFKLHL